MMGDQQPAPDDQTLEEAFKDVKMENAKEMMQDARERMDAIARAREQADQKITYFLGILLVVFSSMTGFGIRPMVGLLSDGKYFPVAAFLLCLVGTFAIICLLVSALLPKKTYLPGLSPSYYWDGNRLTSDPKITLLSISRHYERANAHMISVIGRKGFLLKISVFCFGAALLILMGCVFLFHPDLAKYLS